MKRYDMFAVNDGHDLQECAEGEWVRFEDHEQELIETAGELEKARADVLTFTSRALLSEAALAEATALLERAVPNMLSGKWLVDHAAFLSCAPAQPAAPAPYECGSCRSTGHWSNGLACPVCKTAAPTPRWPEQPKIDPRGWQPEDGLPEPAAPEPSAVDWTAVRNADLDAAMKRAESAEAQLAAVRLEFDMLQLHWSSDVGNCALWCDVVAIRAMLTTATSPGAGECDAHHAFECKLCPGAGGGK